MFSLLLSPSVVPPGEVAREVAVDPAAEGNNDEVVVDAAPKLKPTAGGLFSVFERFANSPDVGFGEFVLPKSPANGVPELGAGENGFVVLLLPKTPENGLPIGVGEEDFGTVLPKRPVN
jgi:hypothetical protein